MFVFICLFFVFDLRHDLNTLSPIHVLYTDARLYTCKSLGRPRLVFGNASYYEKYEDWYVRPHISLIHVGTPMHTCKSFGRPRLVFGNTSYYETYADWCVHTLVQSTLCAPMHVCTHASLSGDRDLSLEVRAITKNTETGASTHTKAHDPNLI